MSDVSTQDAESGDGKAELGFDEVARKLADVVAKLESGSLSLEGSLKAYEEGISLARRGHELLDGAEKRVELLIRDSKGKLTTEPLADPDGELDES